MPWPALDRGFIDTEEVERFERKTALRTSDLIRVIMDVEGVRAVRSISLTTGDRTDAWYLELDWELDYTPVLDAKQSRIRLMRGHVVAAPDPGAVEAIFEGLQDAADYEPLPASQRDIVLPNGRDRQVDHYQSIQHHFPDVYGIGTIGLPASASDQRQAQARQLKAYLLFFDQLLANYFAQLDHAKDLFSFRYEESRRAALVAFRIAGILALVRLAEDGHLPEHARSFAPCEADLEAALRLASTYLEHGLVLSRRMPAAAPALVKIRHSRQRQYYDSLPTRFTTAEAEHQARLHDVSRPTVFRWINQLIEAGLLVKEGQGRYQKTDPRETSETMRLSPQTPSITPILASHAGETFDETSAMQPEANGSRSQSLTPKSHVDETTISPSGARNGQCLKVSRVSLSQALAQPHLAFYRGQRVRTPEGEGEILQYFRDQITVRLGARAAQFVPSVVIPLDETPS